MRPKYGTACARVLRQRPIDGVSQIRYLRARRRELTLWRRPLLPMRPGIPARQTHDYIRHGTTSLFAALNVATGTVIGRCHRLHRHQELLTFLHQLDAALPPEGEVHVVMDNYGTHKVPKVARWFARHPRYHVHFTPTSASWLNQVKRFLPRSRPSGFAGALSRVSTRSSQRSTTTWRTITITVSRSSGPRPPTPFSRRSSGFANELQRRDTRRSCPSHRREERRNFAGGSVSLPRSAAESSLWRCPDRG